MTNFPKFNIQPKRDDCFRRRGSIWTVLFLLIFILAPQNATGESKIAVLVSRNIVPYLEAVEGFSSVVAKFENVDSEVFAYENYAEKRRSLLTDKLKQNSFDLFVAIGPEASKFLYGSLPEPHAPIMYSMVLNPEGGLGPMEKTCGISLDIPVKNQLSEISASIPRFKKIGLVYDPANNEEFFEKARKEALLFDIDIVPLKVSERKKIPAVLNSGLDSVDGLWLIPDRTVISESIVQYIIKEALLRNTPTIGYNKFFYESGAVLAFVFDYRALGSQAGDMALYVLSGNSCGERPPIFQTWVNRKVAEKLGIEVVVGRSSGGMAGP